MIATSAFAGKILGSYRYLFLVLYEDYTDFSRAFVKEFNAVYLERLARNLRSRGAVIVPFHGDVEQTRREVLSKDWAREERDQLDKVPAMIVISKDSMTSRRAVTRGLSSTSARSTTEARQG